jgi:hypothetical protein
MPITTFSVFFLRRPTALPTMFNNWFAISANSAWWVFVASQLCRLTSMLLPL